MSQRTNDETRSQTELFGSANPVQQVLQPSYSSSPLSLSSSSSLSEVSSIKASKGFFRTLVSRSQHRQMANLFTSEADVVVSTSREYCRMENSVGRLSLIGQQCRWVVKVPDDQIRQPVNVPIHTSGSAPKPSLLEVWSDVGC